MGKDTKLEARSEGEAQTNKGKSESSEESEEHK